MRTSVRPVNACWAMPETPGALCKDIDAGEDDPLAWVWLSYTATTNRYVVANDRVRTDISGLSSLLLYTGAFMDSG